VTAVERGLDIGGSLGRGYRMLFGSWSCEEVSFGHQLARRGEGFEACEAHGKLGLEKRLRGAEGGG
jgi:hypothetical protein